MISAERRAATDTAIVRTLDSVLGRMERAGLLELDQEAAELRVLALMRLTPQQFTEVMELEPAAAREGRIAALEAARRRDHSLVALDIDGRGEDDQLLIRWRCACGRRAEWPSSSSEDARAGWELHAGVTAAGTGRSSRPPAWRDGGGRRPRPTLIEQED